MPLLSLLDWSIMLGFVMLVAGCVGAGVLGALGYHWTLHRRLYVLEDAVSVVEGILQREVKIRAAQARWPKKEPLEDEIAAALEQTPAASPPSKIPYWQRYPKTGG